MRWIAVWVALSLGHLALSAATTVGAPLPPRPGPLPRHWGSWSNDAFGGEIEVNPDDLRTNAFTAGLRFNDRWISEIDYSALTNKDPESGVPLGRSDELSVSFGYIIDQYQRPDGHFMIAAGIGGRYAGDLGMGSVQREWHDIIDFVEVEVPYEASRAEAYAWSSWQIVKLTDVTIEGNDSIFSDGSRFGLILDNQNVVTHRGDMYSEVGVGVMWAGRDSAMWTKLRRVMRAGDNLTSTANVVARSEQGAWLDYGLSVGSVIFTASVDLDSNVSTGTFGWMYKRRPMHLESGDDIFTAELGTTLNSYGLGGQVRWKPYWLGKVPWMGERTNLFVDYRFGRVPDFDFVDTSLRYQQASFGLDVTAFEPRDGFQINPYVFLGGGWRIEDVQVEAARSPFPDQQQGGLALLTGVGVRTTWGSQPEEGHGIQYGFSLSYDYWDTRGGTIVESPFTSDRFLMLDDNFSISLRFIASIGW